MRFRAAAVSAAVVLSTATGIAVCSSSSAADSGRADRQGVSVKTASHPDAEGGAGTSAPLTGAPWENGGEELDPSACATSAAEIPPECAVDATFADMTEGDAMGEPPSAP
ncbi:hypothetical protein ACWIG4_14945 [Streptomyces sp. NPDC002248]